MQAIACGRKWTHEKGRQLKSCLPSLKKDILQSSTISIRIITAVCYDNMVKEINPNCLACLLYTLEKPH